MSLSSNQSTQMPFCRGLIIAEMQRSDFYSNSARIVSLWLYSVILTMAIHGNAAETSSVQFTAPSGWVNPHFFNQPSAANPDSGTDARVLLLEQQINAVSNETFIHSIRQILTTAGVQKGATITLDFNPN
ncbi:MAG: hypothetical protein KGJ13_11290, partial [Patescibacteria group bacterium]|nr:hypothetical protein [Patescibacteria group bacterium]